MISNEEIKLAADTLKAASQLLGFVAHISVPNALNTTPKNYKISHVLNEVAVIWSQDMLGGIHNNVKFSDKLLLHRQIFLPLERMAKQSEAHKELLLAFKSAVQQYIQNRTTILSAIRETPKLRQAALASLSDTMAAAA